MKKTRYVIAALIFTAACSLWLFAWQVVVLRALAQVLFGLPVFVFYKPNQLKKPVPSDSHKWNAKGFFTFTAVVLFFIVFIVLCCHVPDHIWANLFGAWYFTGIFWLAGLSALARRYYQEKEESQSSTPSAQSPQS